MAHQVGHLRAGHAAFLQLRAVGRAEVMIAVAADLQQLLAFSEASGHGGIAPGCFAAKKEARWFGDGAHDRQQRVWKNDGTDGAAGLRAVLDDRLASVRIGDGAADVGCAVPEVDVLPVQAPDFLPAHSRLSQQPAVEADILVLQLRDGHLDPSDFLVWQRLVMSRCFRFDGQQLVFEGRILDDAHLHCYGEDS